MLKEDFMKDKRLENTCYMEKFCKMMIFEIFVFVWFIRKFDSCAVVLIALYKYMSFNFCLCFLQRSIT